MTRPLILHRRKQQVVDLPPKQRRLHPVALSEAELTGFDHRVELVLDDYRRRAQLGEVRRDAEHLALLTSMRQIAAEFKLPAAQQLVDGLLASKAERIEVLLGPRRLSLRRQSLSAMVRDCLQVL